DDARRGAGCPGDRACRWSRRGGRGCGPGRTDCGRFRRVRESRELRGVGVSPGLAIAPAMLVRWSFPTVADRSVADDEVDHEVTRLHDAVSEVVEDLAGLRRRALERAGPEEAGIFDAQMMMAQDQDFLAGVEYLIRKNNLSAETAYEFK